MKNLINKMIVLMAIIFVLIGTMAGCTANGKNKEENNVDSLTSEDTTENDNSNLDVGTISYRFADAEEGIELRMQNDNYFNKLTQNDLDYRTGKIGATLECVLKLPTCVQSANLVN